MEKNSEAQKVIDSVAEKKATKPSSNLKLKKEHTIAGVVVGAIILLVLGIAIFGNSSPELSTEIAAKVNNEVITIEELNKLYESTPAQIKAELTKNDLLNQLIQQKLILQEATKQGISATQEEAKKFLDRVKLENLITEEQFQQLLQSQQVTEEKLIEEYQKQLTIQNFLNSTLYEEIIITDTDVLNFYNTNIEQFSIDEQVTVRHILIGSEELTAEEKDAKAKNLLKEINKDNFCEYVSEHSTDVASVSTCGEYTFGRNDPYVEEFKSLSFEQSIGDIGTIQTQFGTHIILTQAKNPASVIPLEETKEQIKEFLRTQEAQTKFDEFYNSLADQNNIEIIYSEQ